MAAWVTFSSRAAAEKDAPAGARGYLEGRKSAYTEHQAELLAEEL